MVDGWEGNWVLLEERERGVGLGWELVYELGAAMAAWFWSKGAAQGTGQLRATVDLEKKKKI